MLSRNSCLFHCICLVALPAPHADAQDGSCDAECQALRDAQDPLADVRAIMTDNTIGLGTAEDDTAYGFQVQPVYSIPTELGFNFIARGIVPIIGVHRGAGLPKLGPDPVGGSGMTWGLSDILLQGFVVPKTKLGIKLGFGPQVSLRARTANAVGGPGWGGGLAVVAFGFTGELSYGGILGHHWGQDDYSLTTLQPIAFCWTSRGIHAASRWPCWRGGREFAQMALAFSAAPVPALRERQPFSRRTCRRRISRR